VKYADDVTLFATFPKANHDATNFQSSLNETVQWATENNMLLNTAKTKLLHLTLSETKYDSAFQMDNETLEVCGFAKLLGVTIDKNLTFNQHVEEVCSKSSFRLYAMRALQRYGLNKNGLLRYYLANIRPLLTYACQAWAPLTSQANKSRLESVQRRALRIIHPDGTYEDNMTDCAVPTIRQHIDTVCTEHIRKIFENASHPLNECILRNNNRKTRVSRNAQVPKLRTAKYQNSFFVAFSKFL
jgi:hypothetical protein